MSLQFARKTAEKLVEKSTLKDLPIDPREIAHKQKVTVYVEELEDGVSGLLVTSGNKASIFVNEAEKDYRQRFSAAHELGHYVLRHHADRGDHVHVDRGVKILQRNLKSSQGIDSAEIEANQFAASLLMPAHLVREAVEKYGKGKPIDEALVEKLADRELFFVSEQALTIRLERLGLL